jgi:hypothetical protein
MNNIVNTVLGAVVGFAVGSFLFEAIFKNLFTEYGPNWLVAWERVFFFGIGAAGISLIYRLNGMLRDD